VLAFDENNEPIEDFSNLPSRKDYLNQATV
jgi:hypothetical protein